MFGVFNVTVDWETLLSVLEGFFFSCVYSLLLLYSLSLSGTF